MGRFTRVVAVDVPHRVTQRGNGRRFVLAATPIEQFTSNCCATTSSSTASPSLEICLMSNHIHLIAIPHKVDGLESVTRPDTLAGC